MVRELSKAQECFLFDCCILIVRFASLSCYSSVNTRIQPVKSYQINESFCSITCCVLLCIVYFLIAVLTCLHCPEHLSLHCGFTALLLSLNSNRHLNHVSLNCLFLLHFPIAVLIMLDPARTLWTCKQVQV